MKNLSRLAFAVITSMLSFAVQAQNPLPDISVREITRGKVQVSWLNPYETCIQLAVQRSTDSIANFRTIFSSQSPELPANGFVDNKPIKGLRSYYRIFYVLQGGAYYFSRIVPIDVRWTDIGTKPVTAVNPDMVSIYVKNAEVMLLTRKQYARFRDSINHATKDDLRRMNDHAVEWMPVVSKRNQQAKPIAIVQPEGLLVRLNEDQYRLFRDSVYANTKDTLFMIDPLHFQLRRFVKKPDFISVYRNDSLIRKLGFDQYPRFRDSMANTSRDTLFMANAYRIDIHPFYARYVWRPSLYVFTNAKGYVTILLPQVKQHRYHIVFYDTDDSEMFQIKSLKETELMIDKANFIHSGWFSFELFEDDKLKEKNKFFLAKDNN